MPFIRRCEHLITIPPNFFTNLRDSLSLAGEREPADFSTSIPNYRDGLRCLFKDWSAKYLRGTCFPIFLTSTAVLTHILEIPQNDPQQVPVLQTLEVQRGEDGFPLLVVPENVDEIKPLEARAVLKDYLRATWGMLSVLVNTRALTNLYLPVYALPRGFTTSVPWDSLHSLSKECLISSAGNFAVYSSLNPSKMNVHEVYHLLHTLSKVPHEKSTLKFQLTAGFLNSLGGEDEIEEIVQPNSGSSPELDQQADRSATPPLDFSPIIFGTIPSRVRSRSQAAPAGERSSTPSATTPTTHNLERGVLSPCPRLETGAKSAAASEEVISTKSAPNHAADFVRRTPSQGASQSRSQSPGLTTPAMPLPRHGSPPIAALQPPSGSLPRAIEHPVDSSQESGPAGKEPSPKIPVALEGARQGDRWESDDTTLGDTEQDDSSRISDRGGVSIRGRGRGSNRGCGGGNSRKRGTIEQATCIGAGDVSLATSSSTSKNKKRKQDEANIDTGEHVSRYCILIPIFLNFAAHTNCSSATSSGTSKNKKWKQDKVNINTGARVSRYCI